MPIISSLVPPGVTACVTGAMYSSGMFYMLVKNGELIIVCGEKAYEEAPPTDADGFAQISKAYDKGLEHIQTAVDDLEFGESSWAFLTIGRRSGVRFVHREGPLSQNVCSPWGRIIPETNIEITKWLFMSEWRGVWNERGVDLKMAWDRSSAGRIRRLSEGYRMVQGLDLTFDVLGHVSRKGVIVGIVVDCEHGRPVRVEDRALVYEAIAKLCKHRILFRLPDPMSSILITDEGKVRLLDPYDVEFYPLGDEEVFKKRVEIHCWNHLDKMFKTLKNEGGALVSYHHANPTLMIVGNPSPERPLFQGDLVYYVFTLNPFGDEQDDLYDYHPRHHERSSSNSLELVSSVQRIQQSFQFPGCHQRLLMASEESSSVASESTIDDIDSPFSPPAPRIVHQFHAQRVVDLSFYDFPYNPTYPHNERRARSPSPHRRNTRHRCRR